MTDLSPPDSPIAVPTSPIVEHIPSIVPTTSADNEVSRKIEKIKKPRSEKQVQAFQKCAEAKRIQEKMKKLLKEEQTKKKKEEDDVITLKAKEELKKMRNPSPSDSSEEEEDSEEEKEMVVKRKYPIKILPKYKECKPKFQFL
jgi:hypothetical protein